MGLLIKLQNGDTALKSLKFGKDRPGGGDSGQPYIKTPIDKPDNQTLNSDFLLRGGISAPSTALEDVSRLTKYFFDFKSPKGLLFTAKQNLLSRVAPKTEASFGLAYGGLSNNIDPKTGNTSPNQSGGFFNAGVYTPLSTLTQAGVVAFGGHLNKQGIDPTGLISPLSIRKYGEIAFENNKLEKNAEDPTVPLALWRKSQNASNEAGRKLAKAYNQEIKTKNELSRGPSSLNLSKSQSDTTVKNKTLQKTEQTINNFLAKWDAYRDKKAVKKLNRRDNAASKALERQSELFQQVTDAENAPKTYANRLLKLWNSSGLNKTNKIVNDSNILFSYGGGPDSTLGIGSTNIKFATLNDGLTPARTNNLLSEYPIKPLVYYNTEKIFNGENGSVSLRYTTFKDISISEYDLFGKSNFLEEYNNKPSDGSPSYRLGITTNPVSSTGNRKSYSSQFSTWSESNFINSSSPNPNSVTTPDFRTILESDYTKTFLGEPYEPNNNIETLFNLGNPGQKGDISNYANGKIDPNSKKTKALDLVNASYIYKSEIKTPARTGGNYRDLIPFNIAILNNETQKDGTIFKKYMHFRAFIKNISDSYSADWDNISYMGRAEKFYKYKGFNRDMSISFTIVAQSVQELTPMYDKLNFLASSLAPEYLDASTSGYMAGNIAYLTIGDYISDQPGIINSLDFEIPEDTTWEIATNRSGKIETNKDGTRELRMLPHRIEVSMKFTPLHKFRPQKQTFQEDKKGSNENRLLKPGTAKYVDPLRPGTANYDKEGIENISDATPEEFDIPLNTLEAENIITSYPNVPITPNPLVRDMGPEVTNLGGSPLNTSFGSNIIFPT
jgi:hypothetical protein